MPDSEWPDIPHYEAAAIVTATMIFFIFDLPSENPSPRIKRAMR